MKTIKGNGVENTILTGAINPGSALSIESASIKDVNVYGGTLYINGGVALEGSAITSGTAVVAFTGGTIGTGGYVVSSAVIDSAVLGYNQNLTAAQSVDYVGIGSKTFNLNSSGMSVGIGFNMNASNVIFSGGYAYNTGVIRTIGGTIHFNDCVFSGNSCYSNGIVYQANNAAITEFNNCSFVSNVATASYVLFLRANNGVTKFTSCTITGNTARTHQLGYYTGGGSMDIIGCVFTSNTTTLNNATLVYTAGSKAHYESCIFSSNFSTDTNRNARILMLGGTVSLVDCYVEPIINSPATTNDIYISATCVCSISGGTYSRVQNLGSQTTLNGNLSFIRIVSGTVNITSGTSISLTSNMSCTAINVTGSCVVNGANILEGTYTTIDSEGHAT